MKLKSLGVLLGMLALASGADETQAPVPTPASAADAPAGARVVFATPVHDFGKINSGEVVRHDFVFTNVGTATLSIREVRPGCGCTTAGTWDKEVEPGKTGKIPIQFNAGSFNGQVGKSITVTCNDVVSSNVLLQLKAHVWTPISVTPASLYFALPEERTTPETKVVRIVNNLEAPLKLSQPESTNASFQATLVEKVPGKEYDLLVTPVLPIATPHAMASFVLKTSAEKVPTLRVQASATIQPAVSVFPPVLTLSAVRVPQVSQPVVTIRNTGTNALVLSDAQVDVEGAKVVVTELQAGRLFRLTLSVPPDVVLEPGRAFALSVRSNHPRYPEIKVPIQQAARRSPGARLPVVPPVGGSSSVRIPTAPQAAETGPGTRTP